MEEGAGEKGYRKTYLPGFFLVAYTQNGCQLGGVLVRVVVREEEGALHRKRGREVGGISHSADLWLEGGVDFHRKHLPRSDEE